MGREYGLPFIDGIMTGLIFSLPVIFISGILGILTGIYQLITVHGVIGAIAQVFGHTVTIAFAGLAVTFGVGGLFSQITNIMVLEFLFGLIGMVIGAIVAVFTGIFTLLLFFGLVFIAAQNFPVTITAPIIEEFTITTALSPVSGDGIVVLFIFILMLLMSAAMRTNTKDRNYSVKFVYGVGVTTGYAIIIGSIFAATLLGVTVADAVVSTSIEVSIASGWQQVYFHAGLEYPIIAGLGGIILSSISEYVV